MPLYTAAERQSKAFQGGVIHFHELLILEKPPEMSKKKRKKKDTDAVRSAPSRTDDLSGVAL